MADFNTANFLVINALKGKLDLALQNCSSLEEAAQNFICAFRTEFSEEIVLARLFATVPFKSLPEPNKEAVSALAAAKGVSHLLNDKTAVLSLLGSCGKLPEWNDRRNSKGHVGIPIVSVEFIDSIPMLSRLLKELGAEIAWIDREDTKIVVKVKGKMAGVFCVLDARSDIDHQGRRIISCQDFVEEHNIRTVFGFGGEYEVCDTFITTIIFTSSSIERSRVEQFMFLINLFKSATIPLAMKGKIFSSPS